MYIRKIEVPLISWFMILELEKHLSTDSVWKFATGNIPHPSSLLWASYCKIVDSVLSFPRTGWIDRSVPREVAETVSAHCAKVAIATSLYIDAQGTPDMKRNKWEIVLTGWLHDLPEWKAPDYTPNDIKNWKITLQGKRAAEFAAMRDFTQAYLDSLPEKLFQKLEDGSDTPENQLIHELDKLDAGVMALNYDARWYTVEEFFPYTQKKLSDPFLVEAFEWLLAREFPTLDYFYQYCTFLHFRGDIGKTREALKVSL